ncbi:MAG: ATP synthase F1 subunit delta [Actinomycetota bacterium]
MSSRVEAYASALLEVASVEGALDTVTDELHAVRTAFEASDDLRTTLTDQAIPVARRQQVVEQLLGDRAHPVTTSLVDFVVGSGRAGDLPEIVGRVIELAAEGRDALVAEVRSAQPLTDDQRTRLAANLSQRMGKNVDVRVSVDSSLMGGIVTQIGDTVIDGSVRTRLARLRDAV